MREFGNYEDAFVFMALLWAVLLDKIVIGEKLQSKITRFVTSNK